MLRKIVFWLHLVTGLIAGLLIAIMSFTGAALAFEKEIIAWAERDARRIEAAADAPRLSLDDLLARVHATQPDAKILSVTVSRDDRAAVALGLPGNTTLYVHPFTGDMRAGHAPRARAFMQTMKSWHTRLNFKPRPGNLGAALNAAANVGFVFLCISGLVLWWPRAWNLRTVRPSLWFVREARGKARDWNWHTTVGFWSLPALFIMALTGVVLSYRWAGDLVFRLAGESPPAANTSPQRPAAASRGTAPPIAATSLPAGALLTGDALFSVAQQRFPHFDFVTLRFNPPLLAIPGQSPAPPPSTFSLVVRERHPWPPFSTTTLVVDAQTGALRRTERFVDLSTGQRARRWIRLLHTGEAFRWHGQLVAGVGCLGGCLLVWTGFAMAWRRFFSRAE